jgi:hypothetical protein
MDKALGGRLGDRGEDMRVRESREICQNLPLDDTFQHMADLVECTPSDVLEQLSDKQTVTAVFEEMLPGIHEEIEPGCVGPAMDSTKIDTHRLSPSI